MNDIPKPDFFPFASTLHPKPISVFVKQNIFDAVVGELPDTLKNSPRLIEVSHGVGVISFVAFDRRPSEFSRNNLVLHFDQWMSLDTSSAKCLFKLYGCFGLVWSENIVGTKKPYSECLSPSSAQSHFTIPIKWI